MEEMHGGEMKDFDARLTTLYPMCVIQRRDIMRRDCIGAIQVLRNRDAGGGCLIFWKKALRRCNVQCY